HRSGVNGVIRDDYVEVAVSVEVAHRAGRRVLADGDIECALKCTIAIAEQDADVSVIASPGIARVGDGQVRLSVPIEIPHCYGQRSRSHWIAHGGRAPPCRLRWLTECD